jgi:TM2 domain-containing membrane protein YozV
MRVQCPRCRAVWESRSAHTATCPECGHETRISHAAPAQEEFEPLTPEELHAARRPVHRPRRVTRERIAFGLALNIFVPGAGTLYAGRTREGWGQLLVFLVGLLTIPLLVGLALAPAAWVWALVSSIQHLLEFDRSAHPRRH